MIGVVRAHPAPGEVWSQIRDAAVDAASRGWPVIPGTFRAGAGDWFGRQGATGLCPIDEPAAWQCAGITDVDQALNVWTQQPYGVLLVCGQGVDALELPPRVAELVPALTAAGMGAPLAAVLPRRLLFVASGTGALLPALQGAGVVLRGQGSWVPLPPTNLGHARASWRISPTEGQELPDADKA